MTNPERVSSIPFVQAPAWLNAIAEDDLGDESEGQNVCDDLDQGSANSEQVRLHGKTYMGSDFFRWIGFRD